MQFNTFVSSVADLDRCAIAPRLQEVLIEPQLLARQGMLSEEAAQELAIAARQRGLSPVLVWDALMPQQRMEQVCDRLRHWDLRLFDAIRVADPGAAAWVQQHAPQQALHFIAETGNHNLPALQGWCALLAPTLSRLILSIELPEEQLIHYCQVLPVPCEVLGAGPILLFYSPRPLLQAHLDPSEPLADQGIWSTHVAFDDTDNDTDEAADSNAPSAPPTLRPFPTLQTPHGTLMFLDKDQFILERLAPLEQAGLQRVRLDLRPLTLEQGAIADLAPGVDRLCQQWQDDPTRLRNDWPRPTRAPFFKANRTTALIPRMKSRRLDQWRPHALAEVIAGEKGRYVAFRALRSFSLATPPMIVLPTRDVIPFPSSAQPRGLDEVPVQTLATDQVFLTEWIKRVVPGSLLLDPAVAES